MQELKPCPFCGHKPVILQWPVSNKLYVACINRKCSMNPDTGLKDWERIEKHIAEWNRRADNG